MPLFNVTHPNYKPHFVSNRVVDETNLGPAAPQRPRIRTDFGQQVAAPATIVSAPAPLTPYSLSGYFSTVRSALVLNAIQMGAWGNDGLPRYLAKQLPTASDPSPTVDAQATAYQAHRTMSYLPAQTDVSEAEFASLNDPTKRAASMASLSDSLSGGVQTLAQTLDNVAPAAVPLIPFSPSVPPWGHQLCNQSYFGVQITTKEVGLNPGTSVAVLQPSNVPGFISQ